MINLKNRTILGIVCIVLSVVVMFAVTPIVGKMSAAKVEVVRVKTDIPEGKQITEDDVVLAEVGGHNLPEHVIKDLDAVIGKYASCDMKTDDYVFTTKISDTADSADAVFKTLNGKKQAVSITIPSFAGGLSGKLKNGDIISVIVTEKGSESKSFVPPELTYVKVITTTTSDGTDKNDLVQNEDGTYELPSTVTLLVTPAQSKLLAGYEENAEMHITLVYRGDEATAAKFLNTQEAVLNEQHAEADKK